MKKIVRLTEQDLHRIVKRSVNKILKESSSRRRKPLREGHSNSQWLERWNNLIDILTPQGMLSELWNCLNSDQIEEYIEWIARNNDLENEIGLNEYDEEIDDEEEIDDAMI